MRGSGPVAVFVHRNSVEPRGLKGAADRGTLRVDTTGYTSTYLAGEGHTARLRPSGAFHLHPEVVDLLSERVRYAARTACFRFCPIKGGPEEGAAGTAGQTRIADCFHGGLQERQKGD